MAEMFNPQNPEILELSRQRKMADLLTSQGLQTPQGQTVAGGIYVPPNPMEYLAKLYGTYVGTQANKDLDQKEVELAKKLRQLGVEETKDILAIAQGTPEKVTELAGPAYQGVAPTAVMPAVAANPQAAMAKALMAQSPQAQRLVDPLLKMAMPEPTTLEREYNAAKSQGYKGTINDFKNQMTEADKARIAIDKQRLGLEGARLNLEQQKIAQEMAGGKLTETQGNATGFGVRAKEANQIAKDLENKGVTIPGKTSTVVSGIAGMTPFVGDKYAEATKSMFNVLPEFAGGLSPEQQQNSQARKNFVSAVLRKESGAAISPQEYAAEERKYFPQLGDSDAVIKQKQDARELAIKALEMQAGPGARFIKEAGAPKKVVNFNDLP